MTVSIRQCIAVALLVLLGVKSTNNAAADDKSKSSGLRVARAAGNSRLRPYQPGHWGQVEVEVTNRNVRDASVFISSYFRGKSYRQYARRFWVPAGARRRTSQLMFLPQDFDSQANSIGIESLVYDQTDGISTDHPIRDGANRVLHSSDLPRSITQTPTAIIADLEIPRNSDKEFALDLVEGCTVSRFRNRQMVLLSEGLPSTEASLDSFRNIVVCSDRIADDAAASRAVRRWVQRGGRLWIMLEYVQQETVERLLGDASSYQEIDRVELTNTQLVSDDSQRWGSESKSTHHDRPVQHVRVIVEDGEVTHSVRGWPAAFLQQFGRGQILYTTLGAKAWARRPSPDPKGGPNVRLIPKLPMERLSGEWFLQAEPSPIPIEAFKKSVTGQIGYQVADRKIIMATLGTFGACLIVAMVWLWRRRRPELMLAVGPALSLLAGAVLVFVGSRSRHSAPDMTAIVQFVEATNNSEEVVVTGMMGVYRQDDSTTSIGAERGGLFEVDAAEQSGTTRQMVWTDFDRWDWSDLKLSSGLQFVPYRRAVNVKSPLSAVGRFGSDW